jgi:Fic-DOC domain mobile mystery protein B
MKINFYSIGQTPIDEDEKMALIPSIDTLEDLNIFEQENIIEAQKWISPKTIKTNDVFDLDFLIKLHNKMFDKTWKWAGTIRKSNKNIGCDFHKIRIELKKLNDDIKFWLDKKTYSTKQLALVFHHRLVKIHIFPNGNGRHARLAADCVIKKLDSSQKIEWRGKKIVSDEVLRKYYIEALRKADFGDYKKLFDLFGD